MDGLRDIRTFLDKNPDEFVIVFIQDEITPQDTAEVFDRAGLTRYAYTHERDEPWPDMRELIASDKRLLVIVEKTRRRAALVPQRLRADPGDAVRLPLARGPAAAAQLPANRGSVNSPLFLLNHWIERVNPSPGLAAKVNERDCSSAARGAAPRSAGSCPTSSPSTSTTRATCSGRSTSLNGLPPR